MPDSVMCVSAEVPTIADKGENKPCNVMQRKQGDRREIIVDWESNTEVRLTVHSVDGLRIETISSEQKFPPQGSVIIVPKDAWTTAGALTFRAIVTLGDDMRTGVQQYLKGGRWEARDAGLATGLLRKTTEVVKSGELSTGAKVRVLVYDQPARTVRAAQTYGHLLPTAAYDSMSITLVSELGDTFLSVRHFGVAEAVTLKPDWIDIAISSSLFLTATIMLTILGAAVQIASQLGSKRGTQEVGQRSENTDNRKD
ncbi:hypothetical protein ROBYS_39680 [Roseobacter sp. OBYS 0001]|nr:hypothetical protein ROBYS_39680 [Roseobacter sp. OBYS 0001]